MRDDDLVRVYTPLPSGSVGQYSISLQNDGGAPDFPVFRKYIEDPSGPPYASNARRQTLDVRAAQALPSSAPGFFPSVWVSSYNFGAIAGEGSLIEQLQVNAPNLPIFQTGTVPFFGDYIDVAGPTFISQVTERGDITTSQATPIVVWTDNRDVVAPADGN